MNWQPLPIIPQSAEHAVQRDQAAGLNHPPRPAPEHRIAVLENAIRQHQDRTETAGDHDTELWAHLDG